MTISIRPATQEDLPAIRDVLVRTWHATYDALIGHEKVVEITSNWNLGRQLEAVAKAPYDRVFLVAEVNGVIIATSYAQRGQGTDDAAPIVGLNRIYVAPEAQNSGVGRKLLAVTLAHFPDARSVGLEVFAENTPAIAFYRRNGFAAVVDGNALGGSASIGIDRLVMEARLPLLPLRPARDDDAQDLFGLITLCFAEYPGCFTDPHSDLPDLVKPGHWRERRGADGALLGGEFLVMEDERGRISACVAVDYPAQDGATGRPIAELHRLYVRPDCRRRGIAEALTGRVEAIAREAGAIKLILWSDTRFEGAHRLYRRLGYTQGAETRPLGDISQSIEYFFEKVL